MKTLIGKEMIWNDGTSWPVGTEVIITVLKEQPHIALIENPGLVEPDPMKITRIKRCRSTRLSKYFPDDFPRYTQEDVEAASYGDTCPSLTGDDVEPDGWDSNGFPSLLLAIGLV